MVLNKLKKVRSELRNSAERYDDALKNIAVIAAEELASSERVLTQKIGEREIKYNLNPTLNKQFFIDKYGSLKNAKAAYTEMYGKQKYGRSWSDFIAVAQKLSSTEKPRLSLEDRIIKIEKFLATLGYQP